MAKNQKATKGNKLWFREYRDIKMPPLNFKGQFRHMQDMFITSHLLYSNLVQFVNSGEMVTVVWAQY